MVSIVSAARDIARIREVSAVLMRHGFGQVVQRLGIGGGKRDGAPSQSSSGLQVSYAARVRLVLEDLGPTFVKLGQLASTRPDLLPAELITELKKLQDSLPPIPFSDIQQQIERSLGAPISEIYLSFEEKPLAAASIAQVHRAKLRTEEGEVEVVAKVQRPSIASTIASDLDILHTLAALLERAIPETKVYSPIGLVQQFDQAITAELDFTAEADNATRFAQNFSGRPEVRFPKIYRSLSSKHVITMEYLDGLKIETALTQGFPGKAIARLAFRSMIQQIYEDGFFHADPHPGNVLILGTPEAPVLGMLDLGMVGRLSSRMRDLTIDVVTSTLRRDHEGIARALYEIGSPSKKIDMGAYYAEVAALSDRYLGRQLKDIELSALIRDLVRAATKYGIEIPTDFVLMGKALMTIEGVGKEIDPDFDVYEEARPLFAELLKKRYSPERLGNELLRRLERLGGASYKVPQQLEEVLDDLRLGRLRVLTEDPSQTFQVDRLGRRIFAGLIVASLLFASAYLLGQGKDTFGYVAFGLAATTLFGHFVAETARVIRKRH